MCPNVGSSDAQTDIWSSIYGASIADRLNALAPGANLVAKDISNLIPLCALETVATGTLSPFCTIFTLAEFAQFEYWADLDKYYGTGYVFSPPYHKHPLTYSVYTQIRATSRSCSRCRLHQRTTRTAHRITSPR